MHVVDFAEAVYKKLIDRQESVLNAMADGNPEDYAAYRDLVGEARGLSVAALEIKALLKEVSDDDIDSP